MTGLLVFHVAMRRSDGARHDRPLRGPLPAGFWQPLDARYLMQRDGTGTKIATLRKAVTRSQRP
ncbi:MAG: hypothetical protein AAF366_12410 [Pseudomonadota bacterium]